MTTSNVPSRGGGVGGAQNPRLESLKPDDIKPPGLQQAGLIVVGERGVGWGRGSG